MVSSGEISVIDQRLPPRSDSLLSGFIAPGRTRLLYPWSSPDVPPGWTTRRARPRALAQLVELADVDAGEKPAGVRVDRVDRSGSSVSVVRIMGTAIA